MGKGDIKTRRGKLFAGTFGKRRPKNKANSILETTKTAEKFAEKKKETKPAKEKAEKSAKEEAAE